MEFKLTNSISMNADKYPPFPGHKMIRLLYDQAKVPFTITVIFNKSSMCVFKKPNLNDEETEHNMEKIIILI